jgi:Putative MetA-pathway of phenol degradation
MKLTIRAFPTSRFAIALGGVVLGVSSIASAQSNSPWLPIPGTGSIGVSYVAQTGDSAYVMGDVEAPIAAITGGAATKYRRDSFGLKLAYGVSDSLSVDATFGHGKARVGAADRSSGLTDTTLAANWRVLDEYSNRSAPTITLRAAALLNGNYDGARLAALGKDASGYQLSVLVGRQITSTFGLWGSLGFEDRSRGIPNATFFDVNAAYSVVPALSLSLGYSSKRYGGGLNIAGPGFSPDRFQQVNEERSTVRLGASYSVTSNQSLALSLGKLVNGRNTVKDDRIIGVGYNYGF